MAVYLDYAATTPMSKEVIETIQQSFDQDYGNASSLYRIGRDSHRKIEVARSVIAQTIQADPLDIIFTSGGTEANNSALIQTARRLREKGRHIITTKAEHSSVYQTMKYLEKEGYDITYLDFDESGHISLKELTSSIREDTIILSIMAGNNEVGSYQSIEAIGEISHKYGLFFHTDTVQTYLNLPIDVQKMHIDALSMSAHKIYGPKGIGFLYYRNSQSDYVPYIKGGNQEHGHRAGTESVPLVLGMQRAIELSVTHHNSNQTHLREIRRYFLEGAKARRLPIRINGPKEVELAHILNIYWPQHLSDQALIQLDLNGFYVSAGSACTAGSLTPSRVLVSMFGEDSPRVTESLRLSFGKPTTFSEIDAILNQMEKMEREKEKWHSNQ